jgi:hypothetical protein
MSTDGMLCCLMAGSVMLQRHISRLNTYSGLIIPDVKNILVEIPTLHGWRSTSSQDTVAPVKLISSQTSKYLL